MYRMRTIYRSAVVGLGNIGFQFSLDTKRQGTWSHVDAYLKSGRTALAGAVEINRSTAERFTAIHPDIPVYPTIGDLFKDQSIDIISVAVSTALHFPVFSEIAEYPIRAIFCEKPLSDSPERSRDMVRIAGEKNIVLAVNYTRRWEHTYQMARDMVMEGKIGSVRSIHAFYSGHIRTMGSHLFDTLHMIAGVEPLEVSAVTAGDAPDPSTSGWVQCKRDAFVTFSATGKKEDLIFEIDLVGDEGRLTIGQNGSEIAWALFRESQRYSGYREPVRQVITMPEAKDRFIEAVRDIAAVLDGERNEPQCTGRDGLWVDHLIDAALRSARDGGVPVRIGRVP